MAASSDTAGMNNNLEFLLISTVVCSMIAGALIAPSKNRKPFDGVLFGCFGLIGLLILMVKQPVKELAPALPAPNRIAASDPRQARTDHRQAAG